MIYLAKPPITDTLVREFENEMFGDLTKTEEGTSQAILKKKLEKFEQLMVTGHGTEIKGVIAREVAERYPKVAAIAWGII